MGLTEIIGTAAVVTTIGQFLAGSLVCKKFITCKSTGESSSITFICGYLSSSLWLLYGLTKGDNNITLVNTVGVSSQIIYIFIFYLITSQKRYVIYQLFTVFLLQAVILCYINNEENLETKMNAMGMISSTFTLVFIAAPLAKLSHVIRVKGTESLPYPVILSAFFVSFLWFMYGYLLDDNYLIISNLIGTVLASLQLCLFVIFPNTPATDFPKLVRDA